MAEWQKGTGWKEWFEITGADGVDFHPIGQDPRKNPAIIWQSNTKEDILERKVGYPKSNYSFWKKINGKKYYISLDNPIELTHKINVTAEAEYVMGHLRGGYYNGNLELSDEDYKEFQKAPKTFLLTHPELWEDWPFTVDGYRIDDIGGISEVYFTDQTHRYN